MSDIKNDKSSNLSFSEQTQFDQDKRKFLIAATACTGAIGAAAVAIHL